MILSFRYLKFSVFTALVLFVGSLFRIRAFVRIGVHFSMFCFVVCFLGAWIFDLYYLDSCAIKGAPDQFISVCFLGKLVSLLMFIQAVCWGVIVALGSIAADPLCRDEVGSTPVQSISNDTTKYATPSKTRTN